MLMIIAHHYVVNSGLTELWGARNVTTNMIFLEIFGWGGKCGINCFILITGYFMCKQEPSWEKFFKLVFQIEFYSIGIYLIFSVTNIEAFSIVGLAKAILVISRLNWT